MEAISVGYCSDESSANYSCRFHIRTLSKFAWERRLGEQRLRLRVDEIGSSLRARPGALTASDRMAALRRRIGLSSRPGEA